SVAARRRQRLGRDRPRDGLQARRGDAQPEGRPARARDPPGESGKARTARAAGAAGQARAARAPGALMRVLLAALALCAARAALAADEQWTLGAGIDASTGSYGGSTETKIVSIPFTAKYQRDRWTFRGMVPFVEISGASSVVPGFGRIDAGNRRGHGRGESSASGLGDSVLAASYAAIAGARGGIDLTGRIKL